MIATLLVLPLGGAGARGREPREGHRPEVGRLPTPAPPAQALPTLPEWMLLARPRTAVRLAGTSRRAAPRSLLVEGSTCQLSRRSSGVIRHNHRKAAGLSRVLFGGVGVA